MVSLCAAPDDLDDFVARIAGVERMIAESLADAQQRVDALHVSWSGSAAEGHRAAHERWMADTAAMHAALTQLRGIVVTASDNYRAACEANVGMWKL